MQEGGAGDIMLLMQKIIIPPKRKPKSDAEYLEELAKAIFRCGFSYEVVERNWPEIRKAFKEFDVDWVAKVGDREFDQILKAPKMIKHFGKITSIIENAGRIKALQKEHGSFVKFMTKKCRRSYPERRDLMCQLFKHVGKTTAFGFLYCVGESVPHWHERFTEIK